MTVRRILVFLVPLVLGVAAHGADLTVIDIANAVVIQDGVLGGGQPDEVQLRQAADAGYRTIVNMRGPDEASDFAFEEELVQSLGMEYVFLPFAGGDAVNEDNARKLAKILDGPDALPAMIHCRSGNRVGILFAAKAFIVDGLDADAAMEFGTASGMRRAPEQLKTMLESDREP